MTIGFDVTWMDKENKSGGVFQYAHRLIAALVNYTDTNVVAIIVPTGSGLFDSLKRNDNFKEVLFDDSVPLSGIVEVEKIDVIHTPVQSFQHLTFSVPMITTLHDLQHFHFPDFFTEEEIRNRNIFYRHSAEFADRVIVSFQHVKDDIVKFYGIPKDKIDVCPLGFETEEVGEGIEFKAIKKKYSIPDKFIFYSANTWKHKNHANLIRALKLLHENYGLRVSLVCTGQKHSDYYPELERLMDELNMNEFVTFTGYIPETDVKVLLKNSTLAVIPTLYEAGSFPLIEAMASGVPVICSNVTSLPETIGDVRFVFDPTNVEEIAEKIALMLKSETLMEDNKRNSKNKVKEGGWDRAISNFVDTYLRAINGFNANKANVASWGKMQSYEFLTNELHQQEKEAFLSSFSWRLTAPLRLVEGFLTGGKGKV